MEMKDGRIAPDQWPEHFSSKFKLNPAFSNSDWSYEKFKVWLKDNMNSEVSGANAKWMEPRSDAKAMKLQKIAQDIENVREPMIQSAIQTQLNKFDTTMVVYGYGHFYKQAPALEKIFGSPLIQCLGGSTRTTPANSPAGSSDALR